MTLHIAMVRNMAHHEMIDRVLWGAGAFEDIPPHMQQRLLLKNWGFGHVVELVICVFPRLALLSTPFRSMVGRPGCPSWTTR